MKPITFVLSATLLAAAPLAAQEAGGQNAQGYVTGVGGFATSVGNTTGSILAEGGVRVAPHVMVIGSIGRYSDLQSELQPTLDGTTSALATTNGLTVTGGGSLPATTFSGGLRAEIPVNDHVLPYVLGTIGVAHLTPQPAFTFSSGTMPDGSTPAVGTDVTAALTTAGSFTTPASSNAFLLTLGGGVQVPVVPHWVVDVGYRYSRIAADSTLSATPLNLNGMTFGFGYRF